MAWGSYYSQPTKAELKARAQKNLSSKKAKDWRPVVLTGRTIAKSWWGKSWCENLERYADYENRLGRGRSYVTSGLVLDLQIQRGKVHAVVQGSRVKPYEVDVVIDPLSEENCQSLIKQCSARAANLDALLGGSFPEEMKELLLRKGMLFPTAKEISFGCTCPDWASMCKHVAAVLYAIGARFDEEPMLFFTLRGIDANSFIDESLAGYADRLLAHAEEGGRSKRVIESEEELSRLFGVL